ncbi:MAG: cupin-like domain-containing protein [Xanthomonadales bacterium]|nr:cupin-like domain-containing protein [Xanthomonadales bacterium]
MKALQTMQERHGVDRETFENEILPANRPVVLRGLLNDWPAVQACRQSPAGAANYLKRFDTGSTLNAYVGPPEINGRFFYADDFQRFNFDSKEVSLSLALDTIVSLAEASPPPAIALQAIDLPSLMPGFPVANVLPLVGSDVTPRIWISSPSIVAPHFDTYYNIACIVSGRRRFTVFPPDQVSNLYIGPLLTTPGGPPISVVDLRNPDLDRFPRFAQALESAQQATLEPGDAIYIPVLWWHGVESLEPLNVLVNYWWNDAESLNRDPMLAMIHAMALISGLDPVERDGWRALFDHFVFQRHGEPGAHLPPDLRDVMGKLSPADRDQVVALLAKRI